MGVLTRYERDAAIGLLTALLVSFFAGFFSYTASNGQVVYGYSSAVGVLVVVFGGYLVYRVLRRVGGKVRTRYAGT